MRTGQSPDADSQGGVNLRVPTRSNTRPRELPRAVAARVVRHRPEQLDETLWTLLTSGKVDAQLDRTTRFARTTFPFSDGVVFEPGEDLGPFWRWADFRQRESVSVLDAPSYVDPRGWVIRPPYQLVGRGLLFKHFGVPRPSIGKYTRTRIRRRAISHPPLLSLRDPAEHNYYHLLCDLFGARLRMADEAGFELPLLVSEATYRRHEFQSLLRMTDLGQRDIIVQRKGDFVRTPWQPIIEAPRLSRANVEFLHQWLGIPESDPHCCRRVFLVRATGYGRGVANMDAVADVARRFGFELVATEDLGLEAEIELFSQARHVIGAMGSGLFNIAWRRNAPLSVLEIYPPSIRRPHPFIFYLARALGQRFYHYFDDSLNEPYGLPTTLEELAAVKHGKNVPFVVDTDRLHALVTTMLDDAG